MLLLIASVLAAQDVGPLDAFRANFASIHANVRYETSYALINPSALGRGRFWEAGPPERLARSTTEVRGRWECDGDGERFLTEGRPKPRVASATRVSQLILAEDVATEVVFDARTLAWHNLGRRFVEVMPRARLPHEIPNVAYGPFFGWGTLDPFPQNLEGSSGIVGSRRALTWNGYRLDAESYQRAVPSGWVRFDVAFDPTVGYLPRFGRVTSYSRERDEAVLGEIFLKEARPCRAGGFIPVESYYTSYGLTSFSKFLDDLRVEATFPLPPGDLYLGHYRAVEVTDREGPVAVEKLEGINGLSTAGGFVPLGTDSGPLTLERIRTLAGPKLTDPPPPSLASIDKDELRKYDRRPRRSWPLILSAAAFVALGLVTFFLRRRMRAAAMLAVFLVVAGGCGRPDAPVPRLSAAFRDAFVVYEGSALETTLRVANEGNVPIRIFKVDGGCSCRQFEKDRLPASIRPGEALTLGMRMSANGRHDPQNIAIGFETDRGPLLAPAVIQALPRHQFSPEAITFGGLQEGSEGRAEFVHRVVYRVAGGKPVTELVVPPGVALTREHVRSGRVGANPNYAYEDTTYRASLGDRGLGLHREVIALRERGGVLLELPVLWQRDRFLSTAPARVTLGSRPVRVFIRCPDESIEFTSVLSAPAGIRAAVISPTELTVRLAGDAPGVIDGAIVVGTTAGDRPPLEVPVVRYSPPVSGSGPS